MRAINFKYLLLLIAVAAVVSACRKDLNDNDIPVAEFLLPDTTDLTFTDSIPFIVRFTDNKNLVAYKLQLTYAASENLDTTNAKAKPFNVVWIGELEGSDFTQAINIAIPDSAIGGQYRAIIACVDESNNQSKGDTITLFIINPTDTIDPQIAVSTPTNGLDITGVDSLNVFATATDASNVIYYSVTILDNAAATIAQRDLNVNTISYNIDEMFGVADYPAGNYTVLIFIRDAYFNATLQTIQIVKN